MMNACTLQWPSALRTDARKRKFSLASGTRAVLESGTSLRNETATDHLQLRTLAPSGVAQYKHRCVDGNRRCSDRSDLGSAWRSRQLPQQGPQSPQDRVAGTTLPRCQR